MSEHPQTVLEREVRTLMRQATRADRFVGHMIRLINRESAYQRTSSRSRRLTDALMQGLIDAQRERDRVTGAYEAMGYALGLIMRHRFGQPP